MESQPGWCQHPQGTWEACAELGLPVQSWGPPGALNSSKPWSSCEGGCQRKEVTADQAESRWRWYYHRCINPPACVQSPVSGVDLRTWLPNHPWEKTLVCLGLLFIYPGMSGRVIIVILDILLTASQSCLVRHCRHAVSHSSSFKNICKMEVF